jgi:hypothetical protein
MEAYAIIGGKSEQTEETPFSGSREKFEQILGGLRAEETFRQSHSELEQRLAVEGRELLRQLVQDHFNLRSSREIRQPGVQGADGVTRKQARDSERGLETIFGEVEIERLSYESGKRGQASIKPMDGELNLPHEKYSFGLQRRLAEEAAKSSFDEATKSILSTTGVQIGKRQAEQLAVRAVLDFDSFYQVGSSQAQAMLEAVFGEETIKPVPGIDHSNILVLTTDGKGIVVLEKDLREATRRAAAKKPKKSRGRHRLSRAEKSNRKRMAQVASVYSVAPFVRTSEDIIRDLRHLQPVNDKPRRPRPQDKRVWASVTKNPEIVIEEMIIEALRRDPTRQMQWAVLVDGSQEQLRLINRLALQYRVQPTIVVDFIHVSEYLWKASASFFPKGGIEAESWVTDRLLGILEGRVSHVAGGIRRSATRRKIRGKKLKPITKCVNYLLKNARYLRYHECLKRGFPIASGVIEGACRHLIKDRLDITGARWTVAKAEAILKLRSLRSSGDFDEYWRFHEEQELHRNHSSRYAYATIPQTQPAAPSRSLRSVKP